MIRLMGLLLLAASQTFAADGVTKFSGYADLRYTTVTKDAKTGVAGNPESGYSIEDGAFYLNHQKDALTFNLDLPFRRFKNSDKTTFVAGTENVSNNANVVLGNDKAQVTVKYTHEQFELTFGQFDTIYGFELNDSKDRFFAKTGLVYDLMMPVTHSGVLLSYTYEGAYARLLSANSNNKGTLGDSATGDNSYEYGTAIGYSNATFRAQVGYLVRPINKATGLSGGSRSLVDITAGVTLGKFTADAEYAIVADETKNTLTATNTDKEDSATGALVMLGYNHDDKLSFAVRAEQVEKDPGQTGLSKATTLGFGAHYKWNAQLETRVDNIQTKSTQLAALNTEFTDNRFEISNLFFF